MESQQLAEFVTHRDGGVTAMGVGPKSGLVVATGNSRGVVTVWALHSTAAPLRSFQVEREREAAVRWLQFDGTEELLLGCAGGLLKVWDLASGRLVRSFSPAGGAADVAAAYFHPSAETIGASYSDRTVCMWDLRAKKTTHSMAAAGALLGFSPDGEQVFVAGERALDIYAWPAMAACSVQLGEQAVALACHPRKRHAAVASSCGNVWLVDVAAARVLQQWAVPVPGAGAPVHLTFDHTGKRLFVASQQTVFAVHTAQRAPARPPLSTVLPTAKPMQADCIASAAGLPLVFLSRSRTVRVVSVSLPHDAAAPKTVSKENVVAVGQQPNKRWTPSSSALSTTTVTTRIASPLVTVQAASSTSPSTAVAKKLPSSVDTPPSSSQRSRAHAPASSSSSPSAQSTSSGDAEPGDAEPGEFLREHADTMGMLAGRLQTLRVVKSLWSKGMKTAALEQLAKGGDAACTIDFLRAVQLLDKSSDGGAEPLSSTFVARLFTVEHFVLVAPALRQALADGADAFVLPAMQALVVLIKAFASTVVVGLRAGGPSRSRGPAAPTAVLRGAAAEIAAVKKLLGCEANFARRSSRVRRARRDALSACKAEFALRIADR